MKRLLLSTALLSTLAACGCTSANRSKMFAYGSKHKVTLYSGGEAVRTWHSKGKVLSEGDSNGYYFEDESTGKLVEVDGDIVIEQE